MGRLVTAVYAGLGQGSTYALIALGFVVIYRATRIISFAQPALMLVGATAISYFAAGRDPLMPFWVALPAAMLLTALVGMGAERVALRPMVGKPVFVIAIITIGIDITVRVITDRFIGVNLRAVGDPWGLSTFSLGGVAFQVRYLVMLITLLLVMTVLALFFRFSKVGLAMRATAADQEVSLAQGISVGSVFSLSWGIAGALAALAGMFIGTGGGIDQNSWVIALKALPAIVVGGLDSVGGAVIGGLVVGLVEALVATYQPDYAPWLGANFALVSPYVVLLIVLLVKPYGLFGTPEVERV
jgi:branched-chain amino acid transport system permease protein